MYDFLYYYVYHAMTNEVVVVEPEATLRDVMAILDDHDFNGLPVVDGNDHLLGLITKLDVLKAFRFDHKTKLPQYDQIVAQDISEIMTRQPETVEPDLPLTRVVHRMIRNGFKSFPVVEQGRLVGVVAREDVLWALRRASEGVPPSGERGQFSRRVI
jgi:CBS domain-containing protein